MSSDSTCPRMIISQVRHGRHRSGGSWNFILWKKQEGKKKERKKRKKRHFFHSPKAYTWFKKRQGRCVGDEWLGAPKREREREEIGRAQRREEIINGWKSCDSVWKWKRSLQENPKWPGSPHRNRESPDYSSSHSVLAWKSITVTKINKQTKKKKKKKKKNYQLSSERDHRRKPFKSWKTKGDRGQHQNEGRRDLEGKERKKKRVIREIKHLTSKIFQSKDGDFVLGIITSPAENEKERWEGNLLETLELQCQYLWRKWKRKKRVRNVAEKQTTIKEEEKGSQNPSYRHWLLSDGNSYQVFNDISSLYPRPHTHAQPETVNREEGRTNLLHVARQAKGSYKKLKIKN